MEVYGSGWNSRDVYDEWENINCGECLERSTTKVYDSDLNLEI